MSSPVQASSGKNAKKEKDAIKKKSSSSIAQGTFGQESIPVLGQGNNSDRLLAKNSSPAAVKQKTTHLQSTFGPPALPSSGKNAKKEKDAEDAEKNKSPDKLLTTESSAANEKLLTAESSTANVTHQSQFGQDNIKVLGRGNDKLPAETGLTDISDNSDRLSTKNSSPAGDKQETPQKSAFGLVDHKFSPEYPHGKTSSSEKIILQAFGQKVPDSTPQKSGVNSQPQPMDTPQKAGDTSQPQSKDTPQKSRVTSQPQQDTFQVDTVPGGNNALKKGKTEKKQTSLSGKTKKDEKQTSSSAHGRSS